MPWACPAAPNLLDGYLFATDYFADIALAKGLADVTPFLVCCASHAQLCSSFACGPGAERAVVCLQTNASDLAWSDMHPYFTSVSASLGNQLLAVPVYGTCALMYYRQDWCVPPATRPMRSPELALARMQVSGLRPESA